MFVNFIFEWNVVSDMRQQLIGYEAQIVFLRFSSLIKIKYFFENFRRNKHDADMILFCAFVIGLTWKN